MEKSAFTGQNLKEDDDEVFPLEVVNIAEKDWMLKMAFPDEVSFVLLF